MKQILILTTNCLVEAETQACLQRLNYEVFCSASIVELLQYHFALADVVQYFQVVVLSETLSDDTVMKLLPTLLEYGPLILRKTCTLPEREQRDHWAALGINDWVIYNELIDGWREKLSTVSEQPEGTGKGMQVLSKVAPPAVDTSYFLADLYSELTDQERLVFTRLLNQQTPLVTKEEICQMLWPGAAVDTKLAHISIVIKQLKQKIMVQGYGRKAIRTRRGFGYLLDDEFRDFMSLSLDESPMYG